MTYRIILSLGLGFFASSLASGVEKPKYYKSHAKRLDYVVLEVNGVPKKVQDQQELVLINGDSVVIRSAKLFNQKIAVSNVNLIGYVSPNSKRAAEDRGFKIRTDRELLKKWAVDEKKSKFEIRAFTGKLSHGEVYVRLVEPELKYAEVQINGIKRILRADEVLIVKSSDKFTVDDVKTNIDGDQKEVEFQVVPQHPEVEISGMKFFEIQFSRRNRVFAKIPLQISGL